MRFKIVLLALLSMTLVGCDFSALTEDPVAEQYRQEAEAMEEPDLYYYKQLDAEEQVVYKTLCVYFENGESEISLEDVETDIFTKAYMAFSYDHPEYFWMSEFHMQMRGDMVAGILFDVEEDDQKVLQQLHQIAESIVDDMPTEYNTYEKVKYLYDKTIAMTEYKEDSEYNQDIRSVLLYGESVCAGYAKTFQFLCNKAGIEAICVSGKDNTGADHMWNLVQIDGKYYWIDTTWDDSDIDGEGEGQYHYFCLTDEELFETHTIDPNAAFSDYAVEEAFKYPQCTDNSYNYYKQKGSYFENYDRDIAEEYLENKIENRQYEGIDLKFRTEAEYKEACEDLFGSGGEDGCFIPLIEDELANQGWREVSIDYIYYDSTNYIVIDLELK